MQLRSPTRGLICGLCEKNVHTKFSQTVHPGRPPNVFRAGTRRSGARRRVIRCRRPRSFDPQVLQALLSCRIASTVACVRVPATLTWGGALPGRVAGGPSTSPQASWILLQRPHTGGRGRLTLWATLSARPGAITDDGCAVDVYAPAPYRGRPERIHTPTPPGCSTLDLGAGTGRIADPLARLGHHVVAVGNDYRGWRLLFHPFVALAQFSSGRSSRPDNGRAVGVRARS